MSIAVVAGWISRILVIVLSFINVKLMMSAVGVEGLAIHAILMSVGTWLTLLNLGLPPAVQNLISIYRSEHKNAEEIKTTALSIMILQTIVLCPVVLIIGVGVKYLIIPEGSNISINTVIFFSFTYFLFGQSILFAQIQHAEHKIWPNLYPALNSALTTAVLLMIGSEKDVDLNAMIKLCSLVYVVILFISIAQADIRFAKKINIAIARSLWEKSKGLLLFSILSTSVLSVDYLIMSQSLNSYEISEYNVAQKIFGAILSLHTIALTANWSITSEELHSNKIDQVKKRIIKILLIGALITIISGISIIIFNGEIIKILTGGAIGSIPNALILGFILYNTIRVWSDTFAMVLLSGNHASVLNKYIPIQALTSIVAQTIMVKIYGNSGIIYGITISFVLTSAWALPVFFTRKIEKNG